MPKQRSSARFARSQKYPFTLRIGFVSEILLGVQSYVIHVTRGRLDFNEGLLD